MALTTSQGDYLVIFPTFSPHFPQSSPIFSHGFSGTTGQASLKVLWTAAWPRLHAESTDVASCVMLLDALLRGAEEELLMTTELRSAMDELLALR